MANRQNTFLIKRSSVAGKVPTAGQLALGELALNTADAILYASGTTANSILPIGWDRIYRTGDTMTGALIITAATNPITLVGLQGVNDSNVLSVDANGVVHTIATSTLSGGSTTLYSGNGSLSSNRIVDLNAKTLNFSSSTNPNTLVMSGGNVGVGILAPTSLFQIGTLNPVISLKQTTTNQEYRIRNGVGTGISNSNWNLFDATNNKIRLLVSGQNFGVGNTQTIPSQSTIFGWGGASGANLDMRPDPAQYDECNIECENSDYDGSTWTGYGIAMQHSGSGTSYNILGYSSKILSQLRFTANVNLIRVINAAALRFATNDTERMVIDSGGTVGIGVTASTNQLHVSASTDPVRFVGLQTQSDSKVLGVDSNGVVHTIATSLLSGGSSGTEVYVTGGTPNNSALTYLFTNNTGGTFTVVGLTDVRVTGATGNDSAKTYTFTNNTGGTFSVNALTDVRVTGGTYSNGTATFTNNTGGTFTVTGLGLDTYVTGGTPNNSSKLYTFTNNTGGTFTVTGLTDLTVTGGTYNNPTGTATFTNNTGGTFSVNGFVTGSTLTATQIGFGGSSNLLNGSPNFTIINESTNPIVTLGTGTQSSQIKFNYSSVSGGDFTGQLASTDQMSFGFNNLATFGGTSGVASGRVLYLFDRVAGVFIAGASSNGFYIGQSKSNYALLGEVPNAGVTAVTIKATGNVGVGLVAPNNPLHISAATNPVRVEGLQSSGNTRFLVTDSAGVMSYRTDVLTGDVYVTGATTNNSAKTYTFTNNTGGTFNVTGLTDLTITGGTTNDSAKTYTFTNNTGGTFSVTGLNDIRVTGGTYDNPTGTATFTNNTGGTFTVNGFVTGTTASGTGWSISGNSGTTVATNFIGTTDNNGIAFRVNNVASGKIGVGDNTSLGYFALSSLSSGSDNTAFGVNAAKSLNSSNDNTIIGHASMYYKESGDGNTGLGVFTLYGNSGGGNTGTYNTAIGYSSMANNTSGSFNLSLGTAAGKYNTTGSNQIFISTLDRANYSGDQTLSPIYIQQATAISAQTITVNGSLKINDGTQGLNKVFTSDVNGKGSWQTPTGGGTDTYVTGGTPNDSGKLYTFTNNTGGTFTVTGLNDIRVTGGTYSSGTATFTNNTGGTFSVTGFSTGGSGGTGTDTYVTGGTFTTGTTVFRNNTGGTFSVTGYSTSISIPRPMLEYREGIGNSDGGNGTVRLLTTHFLSCDTTWTKHHPRIFMFRYKRQRKSGRHTTKDQKSKGWVHPVDYVMNQGGVWAGSMFFGGKNMDNTNTEIIHRRSEWLLGEAPTAANFSLPSPSVPAELNAYNRKELPLNFMQFWNNNGTYDSLSFPLSITSDIDTPKPAIHITGTRKKGSTGWKGSYVAPKTIFVRFAYAIDNPEWTSTNEKAPVIFGEFSDVLTLFLKRSNNAGEYLHVSGRIGHSIARVS